PGSHSLSLHDALPISTEVVAMILLGRIERLERLELRDDGVVPDVLALQLGDHPLGRGLLVGRVIEDCRTILRADVPTLPVQRRRVVDREEDMQQVVERNDLGIERDLHDLRVTRRPRAYLYV